MPVIAPVLDIFCLGGMLSPQWRLKVPRVWQIEPVAKGAFHEWLAEALMEKSELPELFSGLGTPRQGLLPKPVLDAGACILISPSTARTP